MALLDPARRLRHTLRARIPAGALAWHPRLRRILTIVLVAFVLVCVGYVATANVFLALGGVRWLCRGTNSVNVTFASAWTVWPGVVHARKLEVVVQDHNVESLVGFERAVITVRLNGLLRREFRASRVRGEGLSFRFRHRIMPETANLPATRALPPIRGFEDPPLFEFGPPPPPLSDAEYDLWTIELDDVDVAARDVWIEQFHFVGYARAVGAFRLKPARSLWVGPASLTFESGRIESGGRGAATDFSGRVECTLHPFDVRLPQGLEVMRFVSATARLHGAVSSGAAAELFLTAGSRVEPRGTRFGAEVEMVDGVLSRSSRITMSGSSLEVLTGATSVRLGDPWELVASGERLGPGGDAALFVSTGSLRTGECEETKLSASRMSLGVTSTTRDAAAEWGLRRIGASAREVSFASRSGDVRIAGKVTGDVSVASDGPDRSLNEVMVEARARDVRMKSGDGSSEKWSVKLPRVRVSARLGGDRLRGPVSVSAKSVAAGVGRTEAKFDFGADLRAEAVDLETRRLATTGRMTIRNASASGPSGNVDGWWANVRVDAMHVAAGENLDLQARLSLELRDGLPGLMALSDTDQVPKWLPTVLPLYGLSGRIDVRRHCGAIDVDLPQLEGGPLVGSGRIHELPGRTNGAFLIQVRKAGLLTAGVELGASHGVAPFAGAEWLARKLAELDEQARKTDVAGCYGVTQMSSVSRQSCE